MVVGISILIGRCYSLVITYTLVFYGRCFSLGRCYYHFVCCCFFVEADVFTSYLMIAYVHK